MRTAKMLAMILVLALIMGLMLPTGVLANNTANEQFNRTSGITTATDLQVALESGTAQTINVTNDITLDLQTTHIQLGADHTLSIASGKTVTLQGIRGLNLGETDGKTLTVNGGGTLVLNTIDNHSLTGVAGNLILENVTVNVTTQSESGGITLHSMTVGSGATLNFNAPEAHTPLVLETYGKLTVEDGGTINIQNFSGTALNINYQLEVEQGGKIKISGGEGTAISVTKELTFEDSSGLEAAPDSCIFLNANAKVNGLSGKFNDRGFTLTSNSATVSERDEDPSANSLSQGRYYFDGTHFTKTPYTVTVTDGLASNFDWGPYTAVADSERGNYIYLRLPQGTGKIFKEWEITPSVTFVEDTSKTDEDAVFLMPESDVTVKAIFDLSKHTVTVHSGIGGGIYETDATVTITANTPQSGEQFSSWNINGVTVADSTQNPLTFKMPAGPVNATANFEPVPPIVTGITLSPLALTLQKGTTQQFTATVQGTGEYNKAVTWSIEESGKHTGTTISEAGLLTVSVDETLPTLTVKASAVGDNSVSETATVTVSEGAVTMRKVTVSAGANGSILPNGEVLISDGGSLTFAFDPASGYEVDTVTEDGESVTPTTATSHTLLDVTKDTTIHVTFKIKAYEHTVSVIDSYAAVSGESKYKANETVTIHAGSRSGYTFSGWVASGVTLADANSATTDFTMPDNVVTVTATWTQNSTGNTSTGGGSSSTPSVEVATPSTSENTSVVTVTVRPQTTSGNSKAELSAEQLDDIVESVLQEAQEEASTPRVEITVNAPNSAESMELTMLAKGLAELAQNEGELTVSSGIGEITFDNKAVQIMSEGGMGEVTVSIAQIDNDDLNERQKQVVGDRPVYDLTIQKDGEYITSFEGSTVTVTLPYTLMEGEDPENIVIYYVDGEGNIEKMVSIYDEETETITFTTEHFSYYAIAYEEPAEPATEITNPFTDIAAADWFYSDIMYAYANDLMKGISTTQFAPQATATRAMMAQVFHNMEQNPEPEGTSPFTDVAEGKWYEKAVIWASQEEIYAGFEDGIFLPENSVTRQQLATIFYRYAQYKGMDVAANADLSTFADSSDIATWATLPMQWAVESGLITGKGNGILDPTGNATRAEIAAMLSRFAGL